ncbi:DUF3343 domain-containing protein [Coriobacteriales bacterium OH1046]|nr:DUF3343 domain-containing protein [Coriobacteriales bacterium OH1046]
MAHAREHSLLVTFASTHDALAAEKTLGGQGIEGRLIPTPTTVSSECGLAWRSPASFKDALAQALAGLAYEDLFDMERC